MRLIKKLFKLINGREMTLCEEIECHCFLNEANVVILIILSILLLLYFINLLNVLFL
jgi:hypothetical protein